MIDSYDSRLGSTSASDALYLALERLNQYFDDILVRAEDDDPKDDDPKDPEFTLIIRPNTANEDRLSALASRVKQLTDELLSMCERRKV